MNSHNIPTHAGLWPALLTPLDASLDIDIPTFARHARSLLEAGCAGVTPFGTTGEGPSFSVDERRQALDGLLAGGVPAARVLASTSAAALPDVVALTRHATAAGVHACLVLPPFFAKGVPQHGVIDFFSQLIDHVADDRLRIVAYHIPQVSGVPLTVDTLQTLRQRFPGTFIGLKDSGCERQASLAFANAFMPGGGLSGPAPAFQVWVGNEPDLQVLAAHGARGAVSGVGNIAPHLVQRLIQGDANPQAEADLQTTRDLLAVLNAQGGLTAAFKSTMATLTGHDGWRRVRAPLAALGDAEHRRLAAQWQAFGHEHLR